MNSPATSTYLPPLEVNHEREGVGEELQTTLHELVDLSLIGKQLHWAVVGPLFRPLHLQLDELVDSWRELSDTVAERAVALGFVPNGQAKAVAAGSKKFSLNSSDRPTTRKTRPFCRRPSQRCPAPGTAHASAQIIVQKHTRRFFHQFLMAALNRTLTLAEVDAAPVSVGQHLDLDVTGILNEFFDKYRGVSKSGLCLAHSQLQILI